MVEFEAKIWKTGSGSYVMTLPKAFVKNRLLNEGEEYNVLVRETFKKESPTHALATPPWLQGCSSPLGVEA
jgi:hypothetical protein